MQAHQGQYGIVGNVMCVRVMCVIMQWRASHSQRHRRHSGHPERLSVVCVGANYITAWSAALPAALGGPIYDESSAAAGQIGPGGFCRCRQPVRYGNTGRVLSFFFSSRRFSLLSSAFAFASSRFESAPTLIFTSLRFLHFIISFLSFLSSFHFILSLPSSRLPSCRHILTPHLHPPYYPYHP